MIIKTALFIFILYQSLLGLSYLSPSDHRLRDNIFLLDQSGYFSVPVTTWPITWESLEKDLERFTKKPPKTQSKNIKRALNEVLTAYKRQQKHQQASLSYSAASYPITHYLNGDILRNYIQIQPKYQIINPKISSQISGIIEYDKAKNIRLWPDDSHVALKYKNMAISIGTQQRFWGPGNESGLLVSPHAHGIPSLSFNRIHSTPFSNRYLKWMGPWTYSLVIGHLEKNRAVPNTQYFGNRVAFKPLKSLELGLSRAAQWGGDGRTSIGQFLNMLIGNDHSGHPTDSNRGINKDNEPGNQLAGFDFRWNTTLNKFPASIYGEFIGEDSISRLDFIPQPFKFLQLYGLSLSLPEQTQLLYEFSNTVTKKIMSYHVYESNSYRNSIYSTGYNYFGASIGHPIDTNARSYSLGIKKTIQEHSLRYINRKIYSQVNYKSALETNNKDRILANLYTHQHDLAYEYHTPHKTLFINIMRDRYQDTEKNQTHKLYVATGVTQHF